MTRSRLDTVRRVAVLREKGARSAVAAATAARAEAARTVQERRAALDGTSVPAGRAGEAHSAARGRERLAAAVTEALDATAEREHARNAALAAWTAATRRTRLLDEVCTRHRAEAAARTEAVGQRLLDDLASRRRPA